MEAVQGCTKNIVFNTELPCDSCGMKITFFFFHFITLGNVFLFNFLLWLNVGGTGIPPGTKPETCRRCKGAGMVGVCRI